MRKLLVAFALLFSTSAVAEQAIRLTLQQGVPKTDADIAIAYSVCLEPYGSPRNQLTTYDGTNWVSINVPRATYCLSASGLTPSTNYDVLVTASGGAPVMSWSPAYTDDTHPPARAWQDGVEVAASDHTKLVIGAVRVNALGYLEDNHTHRWLSNYFKPEPREMLVQDPAPTWNTCLTTPGTPYCNGTAYQQAHLNAANQIDYIAVVPRLVAVRVTAAVISSAGSGVMVGIGLNGGLGDASTSHQQASVPSSLASNSFQTSAEYLGTPGQGRQTIQWLEHGFGSGTTQTWLGTIPPWQQSGISGLVMN